MLRSRVFKDAVYGQLARIGKVLGSPRRLELLDLLAQGPYTVERLARTSGQSVANTSQHLQLLRRAHVVRAQKRGRYVTYRLVDDQVADLHRALRLVAERQLAQMQQLTHDFLAARGVLEPVDRDVLVGRVLRGEVTVLDVRPVGEFEAGHIKGALSVPLDQLDRRLAELPADREVVAYCRGPYCVLAVEAVCRLRAHGFRAVRLEDGIPDWRARGLPVAVGAATKGAAA